MRKFGTMISYAASTAEVLDLFTRTDFCLVIMDVHPTNKNDLETLYMMRKSKTMPILALTPPISPSDKIMLFQSGANVCLEKPTDLEVCAAQANSLIQLYLEAQEENRADHPLIFGTELIIKGNLG